MHTIQQKIILVMCTQLGKRLSIDWSIDPVAQGTGLLACWSKGQLVVGLLVHWPIVLLVCLSVTTIFLYVLLISGLKRLFTLPYMQLT